MKKVRFGIVGVGNMGTGHAENLDSGLIENGELVAVADINPAKLELVQTRLSKPVVAFHSASELYDSGLVDCVLICTPHYFHPPLSIEALEKGLHVICEKPAGVYTKQVKEMMAKAKQSDKIFAMMFNQRTNPNYIKMKKMISDGAIGELKRVSWIITDWYRTQKYYDSGSWRATWAGEGGGVLFNQCPHQLDLLQWVVGKMPSKITSFCHFGKWHDIEVEDDVTAYLEYDNGATGTFITTTGDCPGTNRLEISGTKGTICYDTHQRKLTYTSLSVDEREWCYSCKEGFSAIPYTTEEWEEENQPLSQHATVVNNVANAILGLEEQYIDGTEGICGVELGDAMLLSTWLGSVPVSLPIDDDLYYTELSKRIAVSRHKQVEDVVLSTAGTYGGTKKE